MTKALSAATIRQELTDSSGVVMFDDLAAHLERDAVFIAAPQIHLIECAVAIALDQAEIVAGWAESGFLRKPSKKERESWPAETERRWRAVVVRPFVIIQDC